MSKICTVCKILKDLTEFHKQRSKKDGLRHQCKMCTIKATLLYQSKNSEKVKETTREWKKKNSEKLKEIKRKWDQNNAAWRKEYRLLNKDRLKESAALKYKNDPNVRLRQLLNTRNWRHQNREKARAIAAVWRKANPGKIKSYKKKHSAKINACTAKRRAKKLKAMPPWITFEQRKEMVLFYKKAKELTKNTGIKHEVDHIVPLQGENICGLHVPWNLQIITRTENAKKSNKLLIF